MFIRIFSNFKLPLFFCTLLIPNSLIMTYTIIALVALTWFLLWAYKHVGIPESISSLFYRPKTQWTYTMVISGVGALMTLVAPESILHYAGISLILGTAAPDYRNTSSLSKYFHFGLTFITAFLACFAVGGIYLACTGAAMILIAFFSRNRIHGLTYFVELILFYVTLISLLYKDPLKTLVFL